MPAVFCDSCREQQQPADAAIDTTLGGWWAICADHLAEERSRPSRIMSWGPSIVCECECGCAAGGVEMLGRVDSRFRCPRCWLWCAHSHAHWQMRGGSCGVCQLPVRR